MALALLEERYRATEFTLNPKGTAELLTRLGVGEGQEDLAEALKAAQAGAPASGVAADLADLKAKLGRKKAPPPEVESPP